MGDGQRPDRPVSDLNVTGYFTLAKRISKHRRRVARLAALLEFPGRTELSSVVRWHDIEKYLFLPWLWKYYAGKGDRTAARKLYDRMNAVGKWLLLRVTAPSSRALRIERIVDVVDRYCDPETLVEFGNLTQRPLEDFLSPEDVALARRFVEFWRELDSSDPNWR